MTAWPRPGQLVWERAPVDTEAMEKLSSELDLTPEQTARIEPIITAACTDLRLLAEEHRAERLALMDEIGATIAPELTEDQQRRIEALEEEWQARPPTKRDMRIMRSSSRFTLRTSGSRNGKWLRYRCRMADPQLVRTIYLAGELFSAKHLAGNAALADHISASPDVSSASCRRT